MTIRINLKNGTDIVECSSFEVKGLYLQLNDCKVEDLLGCTNCTRFYRLVNVMSYDVLDGGKN